MTLEDITGTDNTSKKFLFCIVILIARSTPVPCSDPDSVVLCLLAADEEDEGDIALQIHFTLIQAFCCENDINIVRLRGVKRLEELLESGDETAEPRDMHCMLVTNSHTDVWKCEALEEVGSYCEESRNKN
eukprot:g36358.t1